MTGVTKVTSVRQKCDESVIFLPSHSISSKSPTHSPFKHVLTKVFPPSLIPFEHDSEQTDASLKNDIEIHNSGNPLQLGRYNIRPGQLCQAESFTKKLTENHQCTRSQFLFFQFQIFLSRTCSLSDEQF